MFLYIISKKLSHEHILASVQFLCLVLPVPVTAECLGSVGLSESPLLQHTHACTRTRVREYVHIHLVQVDTFATEQPPGGLTALQEAGQVPDGRNLSFETRPHAVAQVGLVLAISNQAFFE